MPVETKSWPPKTPDAVLDYIYTIPVDEGDSVSSHTVDILAGSIVKDSDTRTAADVTVTLSGGTDGETNVFRIAWVTVAGREDDAIVTIQVVALENLEPRIAELRAMFPAFIPVADATIALWLRKSDASVAHWPTEDQNYGALLLAAHNMATLGLGKGTAPAGVTNFKSGTFSVTMSEKSASATGYASTIYGRQYLDMCQRIFGGARLVRTSDHV